MEDIETALRRQLSLQGNELAVAKSLDLSPDAVRRVLDGKGLSPKNLKAFRLALGLPEDAPLRKSAEPYVAGHARIGIGASGALDIPPPPKVVGESTATFAITGEAIGTVSFGHDYWLGRWEQQTLHLRRVLLDQEALLESMRTTKAGAASAPPTPASDRDLAVVSADAAARAGAAPQASPSAPHPREKRA